jgi:hypothetical protein
LTNCQVFPELSDLGCMAASAANYRDTLVLKLLSACLQIPTEVVCFPRRFMESTKSKKGLALSFLRND